MRDLDFQMQLILEHDDLSSCDKARLYHETLQCYMHQLELYKNRPLSLMDINQLESWER